VKSHIHQDRFITKNPNYLNIIDLARKIADSDIQVLITGESGTGKELMADFLHENSPRANSNFIKVNCSSIPEDLLESELFGESKNNSQEENKVGKFQLANGGTIFLDEIGELPLNIQVKILNILETKEISSGLDSETQKIDVRVIASTNINLEEAVKEKTFREDLFYLLNGANLKLIPLRERPEDISL
ncbi:MAG: sigma-54-dependent Fis family transcriptional regulator, partial [Bdellovibrionales bacterium]|nr:sigma-54-dependent Fis family transcriptional regulator [Bdellovibrionales bacterium]